MRNAQNTTIVLLLISGAILTTLLVATYIATPTAYAGDSSVRQGNCIVVGMETQVGQDIVCVIDVAARQVNLYKINVKDAFKPNTPVELLETVNLDQMFRR